MSLHCYRIDSLEADVPEEVAPANRLGVDDPALEVAHHREESRRLIGTLPDRDREVLLLRFCGNQTKTEIGQRHGISQMHVSRILHRALLNFVDISAPHRS